MPWWRKNRYPVFQREIAFVRNVCGHYKGEVPAPAKTKADGSPIDVDDNSMSIVEMDHGVAGMIVRSWTTMGGGDRMTWLFENNN